MSCCKEVEVIEPVIPKPPCIFRIVAVNDISTLDNFPFLRTAKNLLSKGTNRTISTVSGGFLTPSLLTHMDKGFGMIDCMGNAGVDFVSFGVHEDIKISELEKRIRESRFEWINSNMPNLPIDPSLKQLVKYKIIEVTSPIYTRRVCILGLTSGDHNNYRDGRYGDSMIDSVNETAERLYNIIKRTENVDLFICMTYQDIYSDRMLASKGIFPIILGGFNEGKTQEILNSSLLIKTESNLSELASIDIVWDDNLPKDSKPSISVSFKQSSSFTADAAVENAVRKHNYILEQLEKVQLFALPENHNFSTKDVLLQPSSMASYILGIVKRITGAECVLLCGADFQGNADYTGKTHVTFADLVAEFPSSLKLITLPLPGALILDIVEWSRSGPNLSPPESNAYYLQSDAGVKYYSSIVTSINDIPIEPEKIYSVVMNYETVFNGKYNLEPLKPYIQSRVDAPHPLFTKSIITAYEIKYLIVGYFSKLILYNILSPSQVLASENSIETSDLITKEEFRAAATKFHKEEISDLLVDNLFSIADTAKTGKISKSELSSLFSAAANAYEEPKLINETINSVSAWVTKLTRKPSTRSYGYNDSEAKGEEGSVFSEIIRRSSIGDINEFAGNLVGMGSSVMNTVSLESVSMDTISNLPGDMLRSASMNIGSSAKQ